MKEICCCACACVSGGGELSLNLKPNCKNNIHTKVYCSTSTPFLSMHSIQWSVLVLTADVNKIWSCVLPVKDQGHTNSRLLALYNWKRLRRCLPKKIKEKCWRHIQGLALSFLELARAKFTRLPNKLPNKQKRLKAWTCLFKTQDLK